MWQVQSVARSRNRAWLVALTLVAAVVFGLSACNSNSAPPPVQVIADKGTPFGDLRFLRVGAQARGAAMSR